MSDILDLLDKAALDAGLEALSASNRDDTKETHFWAEIQHKISAIVCQIKKEDLL